jgi:hypothetical protein
MNPNNYATLEQAKKMKELGFPQDKTDCVWMKLIGSLNDFILLSTGSPNFHINAEWYAAPNAQEIEFNTSSIFTDCNGYMFKMKESFIENGSFGKSHHAQARASAWIWEKEKK